MADKQDALVLHVIIRLDVGGLENGLVNLINHSHGQGFRHAIVCLTESTDFRKRIVHDDVEVYALNKKPGKDPRYYLRLWRLIRQLKPSILHTRNFGTLECQIVAALAGVRHRVHGEHGWDVGDLDGSNKKYQLIRKVCRRFVHRQIALSKDLENYLHKKIGVPSQSITRIVNGVDTQKFCPDHDSRSWLRNTAGVPQDSLVIGNVGRMQSVKDPLNLVRAFASLLRAQPDLRKNLRLVMVGNGPLREDVEGMVRKETISDLVWFPGESDEVAKLLQGFDVFVLPSKNEGISNTILEAMATKLPIVATNVGGTSDIVAAERNGILVAKENPQELSNALARYIADDHLRANHGDQSRALAESQFSIRTMVERYLGVYREVMA